MSRAKRILLIVGASLAGLIAVLVITALLVVQTAWFSNFVRGKIVTAVEDATGGQVDIGSFQFDPWNLTVRIRNFVLHGTEPRTVAPLAQIQLLEIHLKLLSGIAHTVDLAYVGIAQPQVNLIAYPDGTTNIPSPKVKKPSSNSNGLQNIVDLKIGEFRIENGSLDYLQQKSSFGGHGQNLRALLNYNSITPSYAGRLSISPLLLVDNGRPPLRIDVDLPATLEGDAIRIRNASLSTKQSRIALDVSIQHLNAPLIDGHAGLTVSIPELKRSFDLPLNTAGKGVPQQLTADLAAHVDQKSNVIQLQRVHLQLGSTIFDASGTMHDASRSGAAAQFRGNLALGELASLLSVSSPQVSGALVLHGDARLDAQNNYDVNGSMQSEALSIRSGGASIRDVSLTTPFHADPYLISLDGLRLNALGGSLAAKIFLEKLQTLSVEGNLHNFSLPVLARVLTGKRLGYDGSLNGKLTARGDLKAKGSSGVRASADITVTPGPNGIPVSGRIDAAFEGSTGSVALSRSYIALPHSRLDLAGSINQHLDLSLQSHNLSDFLPALNFGSTKPSSSLPITLQKGGVANVDAVVKGQISDPSIMGHIAMRNFAAQNRVFNGLTLDLAATQNSATVQNGALTSPALQSNFDASLGLRHWSPTPQSPLAANVTMRNGDVADLLSLAGQSSVAATGALTADVHIAGTYGNPLGSANVQVANGSIESEPFSQFSARLNLGDRIITLSPLELASSAGTIDVNATFQHPRESFSVGDLQLHVRTTALQLGQLRQVQQQKLGVAGAVQVTADFAARLSEVKGKSAVDVSSVNADLSARGLRIQNQSAGDLTLTARTSGRSVHYNLASDFAGSTITANGDTTLATDYPTTADLNIQGLSIEKTLGLAGQSTVPATGTLSALAHLNGTITAPQADLTLNLSKAHVYQETIDRLAAHVRYSNQLVDIPSLELEAPAGTVTVTGSLRHPANSFDTGDLQLSVKSTPIVLARITHVHSSQPTLAGTAQLAADLSAAIQQENGARAVRVRSLNADASTEGLQLAGRALGGVRASAKTTGSALNFMLDSDLAQSKVHAAGRSQLTGDYPTSASLTFSNIKYSSVAPFISEEPTVRPAFDALVEGNASLDGPALKPDALTAQLELSRLEAHTSPLGSPTGSPGARQVGISNQGPIRIALNKSVLDIQQFRLAGPGSTVDVSGSVDLKHADVPMNVKVDAGIDLTVLQDIDREIYSNGKLAVNAAIHGTVSQPLVNGRIELKNANLNYAEAPNGISNANGVILLTGTGANIQTLTGQSGGGEIKVTGFAGFSGSAITYDIKATGKAVRVRYSGISVTSNSTITLTGNTNRSLVSGTVTIDRIAYNSSSDAGSLLSSFTSTPPSTPTAPSALLSATRLNIRVVTAPDLRVITTYANRLAVEANLTVRGTAVTPGVLGRVVITDGQLVFFGNTYTVNTGTINFYNPTSIQPIINISLQTLAQGVDVTLGVSGPMNNLQLSYTSDPPLSFEQIVELLATNTTPNDPNIVANQPATPQQSFTQMGESAILGQAVANPLASRVQRVFGLSQFKIDPSFSGSNGQPSARVTLQQKIANNITFTYITDVTQTNSEIVRVQWDLTPKFSAVGLRDFNGNVSVEFFYKFKVQ